MNSNRFLLVLRREYYSIVGKKSFLLATLLMPIALVAMCFVPVLIMELSKSEARNVAIVDQSGQVGSQLESTEDYIFVSPEGLTADNMRDEYEAQDGELYAIVVIPENVAATRTINIYSASTVKHSLEDQLESQLNRILTDQAIAAYNIPDLKEMIADSRVEISIKGYTWADEGESTSSTGLAVAIGGVLSFLTYMFVLIYGSMIMSTVVEDKSNRIVEVIVSSCRPLELMLGKIVGVGLVGLTQIAIWAAIIGAGLVTLSLLGIAAPSVPADTAMMAGQAAAAPDVSEFAEGLRYVLDINWLQILTVFVIYFIGGYLLYASLFAAFGSAVDQQSEASQFMMPIMIIVVAAMLIGQACMADPDTPMAVVCSYIPFTSPIVMMVRLPYDVPAWEIGLSIALLYATALLLAWIAARIYRVGILRFGRKPSYGEMLRWIKQG